MTSLVPRLLVKNYLDDWHLVNSVCKRDLLTSNEEFIDRLNVCRPNAGWKNVFGQNTWSGWNYKVPMPLNLFPIHYSYFRKINLSVSRDS
jgi:hypothetical protein